MPSETPPILPRMQALADVTRARGLRVLERHELTVAELGAVLQLPQSTTSRHLKVLSEEGWVVSRREGTAALYRMMLDDLEPAIRKLWLLVREQLAGTAAAEQDDLRLGRVLEERRGRSDKFFNSEAGKWDHYRSELFGDRFDLQALAGLLDPSWAIADVGCGTGQLVEAMSPFVREVVAVDPSSAMLKAARRRLGKRENVTIKRGGAEALPIEDGTMDAVTLVLVLHHLNDPSAALGEAARALKPGGRLLVVDMLPHGHREYQQMMGHVWMGFEEGEVRRWLEAAGLEPARFAALPTEAKAKGPALFAASASAAKTTGAGRGATATAGVGAMSGAMDDAS